MLGIIGGTGLEDFYKGSPESVSTQYGVAEIIRSGEIAFLARHGSHHSVAPHAVNYRANIHALSLSCDAILSVCAVGIIDHYRVGDIVLIEDFIGSFIPHLSFFDSPTHTPFSEPYTLNPQIIRSAEQSDVSLKRGGILVGVRGPRLETRSEIEMFRRLGGNLVGMTTSYEAILAKERAIPFANIAICCNLAPADENDDLEAIGKVVESKEKEIVRMIGCLEGILRNERKKTLGLK